MFDTWNVVFEGGVGAGKSSICSLLDRKFGYFHVKEYMSFVDNSEGSNLSTLQPKERVRFFLKAEQKRISDTREHFGNRPLAIDRCFLSIFAFEFARRRAGKDFISLDEIFALQREEELELFLPARLVFLDVSEEVRTTRVRQRNKIVHGDLVSSDFNDSIRVFFSNIEKFFGVEWINSEASPLHEIATHFSLTEAASKAVFKKSTIRTIPEFFIDAYSSN